jgi:hypothetical protein
MKKEGWGKKLPRTGHFGEEDWDGGRRCPGLDILEKRTGKPADGGTYIHTYIYIKPP